MNRMINKMAKGALAFTAAALLGGVPLARAQEETGKLIEKLVLDVDKQLAGLEALTDQQAGQKESWKKQLEAQYARYDQAADETQRAAIRSEIIGAQARLNKAERVELKATSETVVSICDATRKLQAAVQSASPVPQEKLQEHKAQMDHFVHNVAKIVRTIEKLEDPKAGASRNNAVKNSVAMLYRQLADPLTGVGGALERVASTIKTLEDVAVQLEIVRATLDQEHALLVAAANGVTIDLVLLRLRGAQVGADSVVDIPLNRSKEVVQRVGKSWERLADPAASVLGGSPTVADPAFDTLGW